MANHYCGSVQYAAVTAWSAAEVVSSAANGGRGTYRRQLATPAVNSERVFRCTTSGTTGGTEPTWTITKNGTTNDGTAVWTECTGQEADQTSGTWRAPHARLTNALATGWPAAGDTIYVAHDHAETQSTAMSIAIANTVNPIQIICVLATGTVPPVSADLRTTGTVTTTGNSTLGFSLPNNQDLYVYGLAFNCGSGAVNAALTVISAANGPIRVTFKSCALAKKGTTGVTPAIAFGTGNVAVTHRVVLDNTTLEFGATSDAVGVRGTLYWRNTASAIAGATLPTTLFGSSSPVVGGIYIDNVDLSALSGTIFGAIGVDGAGYLQNVKLHASATVKAAAGAVAAYRVDVVRADSGGTNYRHERYAANGSQVVETTIVRTGGASDGTTPIAWKLVSLSSSRWVSPFESMPMAVWVDVTTAVTLTVYGIAATLPTQDDIWIEASYLGAAGSPLGSIATTAKADYLATAANTTSDGSTWGGSTTAFRMAVTFTPAQKGFVSIVVKVGGVSKTIYIDPRIVVT